VTDEIASWLDRIRPADASRDAKAAHRNLMLIKALDSSGGARRPSLCRSMRRSLPQADGDRMKRACALGTIRDDNE